MSVKKIAVVLLGAVAMVAIIVFGIISLTGSGGGADNASSNAPASGQASASAFAQPTLGSGATASASTPPKATAAATPTPSATVSPDGDVPVVAPTLTPMDFSGIGYSPAMEANLTPEEIQARTTIYRVLPVLLNDASHKYTSPAGARDELLSQSLITSQMAAGYFAQEFSNFQLAINKAQYTVQTTGMQCFMRGQSAQTALQLGHVSCYYTRHYLDAQGNVVGAARYQSEVGGAGAIDPSQEQRSIFYMKKDGGVWKVDSVQLQAH